MKEKVDNQVQGHSEIMFTRALNDAAKSRLWELNIVANMAILMNSAIITQNERLAMTSAAIALTCYLGYMASSSGVTKISDLINEAKSNGLPGIPVNEPDLWFLSKRIWNKHNRNINSPLD
jgi:hypothetical protein